jgi:protein-disulfide isomerase
LSVLTIPVTRQDHMQGRLNAPCILVEYADYECPACGSIQPVIKKLQAHFGDGLSFVFRNFPLQAIHPWARPAAELAELAGRQGRFWEMHDLLFANQANLNSVTLLSLCEKLGLKGCDENSELYTSAGRDRIEADFAGGLRGSVNGTPTLFLNGERYDGSKDYASLVETIEQVLASDGE